MAPDALTEVAGDQWDPLLDRLGLGDAYLRRGYLHTAAVLTPAEPVLLHLSSSGGDVVFACLVRSDPTDVITPYGYGGPVASGSSAPVAEFVTAYEQWCRARGAVSSFVVYHPLFANQGLEPTAFRLQALADTVAWNLEAVDLLDGMHRHHRRMVRRAQAGATQVQARLAPDTLDPFRELYIETMVRANAEPFYLFGEDYFSALARDVPVLLVTVSRDGEPLASVLGLTGEPWLHYHLGASSEPGRALGASHLALYELARWGQTHGYTRLHLGGGVGGREDSLHLYKQRFAPGGLVTAAIGKAVHDPERYRELTGQTEIAYDGFFPAYRAPH